MVQTGIHLLVSGKHSVIKILLPTATGRLSDGAAVSVSGVGFSSRSAWLQAVIFETDTAGGKMAGGM